MAWKHPNRFLDAGPGRRQDVRHPASKLCVLRIDGEAVPIVLGDISYRGTKLALYPAHHGTKLTGHRVVLEIPGLANLPLEQCWATGKTLGTTFALPSHRIATLSRHIDFMLKRRAFGHGHSSITYSDSWGHPRPAASPM